MSDHAETQGRVAEHPAVAPLPDEAWDEKRNMLEQLYLVEDRDLKDIIEILKSHGFLATRKQYLRHFKRWRIEKNIKTHEYRAMVRIQNRRLAEGKQTEFTVRKRPVPRDKISRFLRKYDDSGLGKKDELGPADPPTPPDIEYGSPPLLPAKLNSKNAVPDEEDLESLPATARVYYQLFTRLNLSTGEPRRLRSATPTRVTPPLHRRLSPPQSLWFPEKIFLTIHDYLKTCICSGIWAVDPRLGKVVCKSKPSRNPLSLFHFIHLLEEVTDRLQTGKATAETFRLLNIAFSMVKGILVDEDPQGLHNILKFYYEFCSRSTCLPELSRIFVTYCIELASTVLGETHPIVSILRHLSSMSVEDGMQCVRRGFSYIQEQFVTHFGMLDPRIVSYELVTLRKALRLPTEDPSAELRTLIRANAELERSSSPSHRCFLWWINLALADVYLDDVNDPENARRILEQVEDASLGPGVRLLWNLRLGEAALGLGEGERAVEQFTAAMPLCRQKSEMLRVLGCLERAHTMCGNEGALAIIRPQFQLILADMETVARSSWNLVL